ncbi:acyl CoA:acetate/3-ketoacid CoA transferase [Dehalobacter sp. DCM]|uniref:acyl CoA:acetate/3-ketoacid CoA transferase n=1 Tax=Dehalobacter sp. DCM TaxID=2907827 RepID=UPI003081A8B3|nr:acyl CoA:acetate/3-ketoacid CoA transferase [Dehalobacter sp. DCM]
MPEIITAEQAAELIRDESTVAASGFGLAQWSEEVALAIAKRYTDTGHPKNIQLVHSAALGDWKTRGVTHLGIEGLVKRWIGGHIGSAFDLIKLLYDNKLEAYCLPQGVMVQLWRETAAKRAGLLTKVGLGTFVDPRIDGGKMNPVTTEDIVKVVEFEGEEWLFYKRFPVDYALIRGTTADENGNITMEKESMIMDGLPLAQATKNSGGKVIVQVEYLAKAGTLHPKQVVIPGILVDYVVVATKQEACWQTEGVYYNPAFSGEIKIPLNAIPPLPLDERKIVARRAAMELIPNAVVNLGVGIPSDVAAIANEEGVSEMMTMTTESGGVGGVPASLPHFGSSYNAEALVDTYAQFDYYDGGGIDVTFVGLAQTDKDGNVNVSKFRGRAIGIGGFMNVTSNAKKVVYCGTFTAGGLEVKVEEGKLSIVQEGKNKKFVDAVEQITFSGKYAQKKKQPVIYITERAVFVLEDGGLTLTEIAPGIDLQKDILDLMEFQPKVSPNLKTMPAEIFQPKFGILKEAIEANKKG